MQCQIINFICLSFGIGIFFKCINYFAFIAEKIEWNTFF
jgi:hypothetical protein